MLITKQARKLIACGYAAWLAGEPLPTDFVFWLHTNGLSVRAVLNLFKRYDKLSDIIRELEN
jgi:hypothetical protein